MALLQSSCLSSGSDSSDRLPWDSSPSPLHRPCRASTPACVAARFGREAPASRSRSILVVSHHPDGFLRPEVAGLLHPAASHEVRRVSCYRASADAECRGIPHDAFRTPRRIPPYRSRSTSLWPLPPCRCLPAAPDPSSRFRCQFRGSRPCRRGSSTSRLSSAVGPVTLARPLPVAKRPILPWALFPFEVLPRTVGSRALDPSVASSLASEETTDPRRAPLHPAHARAYRRPAAVSLRRPPGSTGAARKRLWCLASTLVPGCPGPIGARCGGSDPSAGSIPAESVRSRSG